MTTLVWSAALLALLLLTAFSILVRRMLVSQRQADEDIAAWLETFTVTRYRPMERLLSEADYEFLAEQPGFTPSVARGLRSERRRVFRMYLRQLSNDFSRLHQVARLLVLYSPEDRPELARTLLRQKWVFHCAMLNVRWQLLLHGAGVSTVDVSRLLGAVDRLNLQVRQPALEASLG